MTLDRISLAQFRNHRASELAGVAQVNLLVGENGAGKTNVLEALSLLAPGRGLRRAPLAELARKGGTGGFAIGADLAANGTSTRLGTYVDESQAARRRARANEADTALATLGEWLAVSWLTPAMDGLFMAAASERRRYMDRLALALDPGHAHHAGRYEAALRQRNRLLSERRTPDAAWLDAIEAQMARHGAALAQGRTRLIDTLMGEIVTQPAQPFPRPALSHLPGGPVGEEGLSQALHDGRARDIAAGRTLTGPHRDDLGVVHAEKRAPAAQCSTGEQKAMLIAITLAHSTLAARGRPSVLLLDEIAAHLDPLRRTALFKRLRESGAQVWMTGTEIAPFEGIAGDAAVWRVSGGEAASI